MVPGGLCRKEAGNICAMRWRVVQPDRYTSSEMAEVTTVAHQICALRIFEMLLVMMEMDSKVDS